MNPEIFKYLVLFSFAGITFYLSYLGMKKAKDIKGFSIGNGDMSPLVIGMTMAASISSTATFVINPGFVYTHGLSAFLHYGVAALFGILTAFLLLTKEFRRLGSEKGSLTIPDWILHRYGHRGLSTFFACINLLSISFVVLILVGCSLLLSSLLPVDQRLALVLILVFVFSYVLMGGSYAHAYTNTLQGVLMFGISLFLFGQGYQYFQGDLIGSLQQVSNHYASAVNPESNLYYSAFSVFVSGFIITFALMLQPHIFTKILYLKNEKDTRLFLITTMVVAACFSLMLFIGFYARLSGLEVVRQDAVVAEYILHQFGSGTLGPYILTFVSITLLAAGLGTLDGILVSLSAMVVNDIYSPYFSSGRKKISPLSLSRIFLVIIGLISFGLAWNPPALVGLFAQKGVYGLAAASLVPICAGALFPRKRWPVPLIFTSSFMALLVHLYLNIFAGFTNPAVSATHGIFASIATFTLGLGGIKLAERMKTSKLYPASPKPSNCASDTHQTDKSAQNILSGNSITCSINDLFSKRRS